MFFLKTTVLLNTSIDLYLNVRFCVAKQIFSIKTFLFARAIPTFFVKSPTVAQDVPTKPNTNFQEKSWLGGSASRQFLKVGLLFGFVWTSQTKVEVLTKMGTALVKSNVFVKNNCFA